MASLERPLVVVGDVHLSHGGPPDTGRDLARLVRLHPGAEVVLNGDIFNLSLDDPGRDPIESVTSMLLSERALRTSLRQHLQAGGAVSLLPGNHDAAVATPGLREALLGWLELEAHAPLRISPWFLRRGTLHIEHGHAYDPDNAPTHPLSVPTAATEPLGVALTRRFLAPHQAFAFAHATEITPVQALARAARVFGARMPLMLASYFAESSRFCMDAGFHSIHADEQRAGDAGIGALARESGVEETRIRAVLSSRARPTHESFEQAFFRLYFDRAVSTLVAGTLLGAGAMTLSPSALGLGLVAALYLTESVRGKNRYAMLPVRRLRAASERVRRLTGAEHVIFGHTHVPESCPGYLNPGSFEYRAGAGRPYAWCHEAVSLRELPPA